MRAFNTELSAGQRARSGGLPMDAPRRGCGRPSPRSSSEVAISTSRSFAGCWIDRHNRQQENCHLIATRHLKTGWYEPGQPPAPFVEKSAQMGRGTPPRDWSGRRF
jgi:hypothetical protein